MVETRPRERRAPLMTTTLPPDLQHVTLYEHGVCAGYAHGGLMDDLELRKESISC
jgi:hypothetical protein